MAPNTQLTSATQCVWIDSINPSGEEIDAIFEQYEFHELDRDAILDEHQYARLDTYKDYLFLVLHFPKYNPKTERYITNELNIFVGSDFLITFRYYVSNTIWRVYQEYTERKEQDTQNTSAFLLYAIIEAFLNKTMKMMERFRRDLKELESELFERKRHTLIRTIMVKKRNIITLKHMMRPQVGVLRQIEQAMKVRFSEEVELYFENLEDKIDKIFSEIQIIEENIDSMEDTLKSIFNLETNTTIKYLTIFSAFMLPLTLVTSFFGMNVEAGHFNDILIMITLMITTILFSILMYFFFFKKNS